MVRKSFLTLGLMSLVVSGLVATEFKYKTYGGFWEDTPSKMESDVWGTFVAADDGPWFREGAFSTSSTVPPVSWGDQDNSNKMDPRSPHNPGGYGDIYSGLMWPAVSWGRDLDTNLPLDPWKGHGYIDNDTGKRGASGLGLTGFGYPKTGLGRTVTVNASGTFAPVGAFQHVNNPLNFIGSNRMPLGWNLEIYRADGTAIDDPKPIRHYHFILNQWETWGAGPCPRNGAAGTEYIDTVFNKNQTHKTHLDGTGVGLDLTFATDGVMNETSNCSDPFSFEYVYVEGEGDRLIPTADGKLKDTFTDNGITYDILLSGLYERSCGTDDIGCFTRKPTLWSVEGQTNTGYVRIEIVREEGDYRGCTPGYWKLFVKKPDKHVWPAGIETETLFNDASAFGCSPSEPNQDISLGEAIDLGGGGENALLRHAVAAWLNATSGEVNYPVDPGTITAETCTALLSEDPDQIETLKNKYEGYNEGPDGYDGEWCPLN